MTPLQTTGTANSPRPTSRGPIEGFAWEGVLRTVRAFSAAPVPRPHFLPALAEF
jgi:hypothetical protein